MLVVYCIYGFNFGNLIKYDVCIVVIDYIFVYDDGILLCNFDQVQVIFFGVLCCGKIFISLYFVMQYGICVVNYLFIVDDMDNLVLLVLLKFLQYKMFGLIINLECLVVICEECWENSCYVFLCQCWMEVIEVEVLYCKNKIFCLNSINYFVEEIVIKIMDIMGLNCRMY